MTTFSYVITKKTRTLYNSSYVEGSPLRAMTSILSLFTELVLDIRQKFQSEIGVFQHSTCLLMNIHSLFPLIFFVELDFKIAVDQQTRAHDQNFEGVPDSGCPYLVNFCQITLTCSQPCFGVLYL